jgi:activator of HSP90 ATPase
MYEAFNGLTHPHMTTTTIHKVITFEGVTPHDIYEALLDEKRFEQWSGAKASISRKIGGWASLYGGVISAKNVELVDDEKLVQLWRTKRWPKGYYHPATFLLQKTPTGTRLSFTQDEVPLSAAEAVSQEWEQFYWEPMKRAFGNLADIGQAE